MTLQWNILCSLPQYVFGMCVGNLLKLNASAKETAFDCPGWVLSFCGDVCFLLIPTICLFFPIYTPAPAGYEVFWHSGLGWLIGGALYFTCHPRCGPGFVKTLFGSAPMTRLGGYSFYIYALHVPVNELIDGFLYGFPAPLYPFLVDAGPKMWLLYLVINVLVAAFLTEVIENKCAIFMPVKQQNMKEHDIVASKGETGGTGAVG